MNISRDEFDQLAQRVASIERQNRAIISLVAEQVMTIVPAVERAAAQHGEALAELTVYVHELAEDTHNEFGKVDHHLSDINTKLDRLLDR